MPQALGAIQNALHLAVQLGVVVWLDVQHKFLVWHSKISCKGKLICPAQLSALPNGHRSQPAKWVQTLLTAQGVPGIHVLCLAEQFAKQYSLCNRTEARRHRKPGCVSRMLATAAASTSYMRQLSGAE